MENIPAFKRGEEKMKKTDERVVKLTQTLIQNRSYSGEEGGVSNALKEFFEANGFDDVHIDRYGNTIGHIKGNRPGPAVLMDGHMDTVPVTNEAEWKHPPFAAEIHDDRIYGRGTSDMKGALAAMAVAASQFKEETNGDFAGDIYVAGIVHEECFEGVAAREVSAYAKPDYVVIGEASLGNLKIGQRGRAEIKVETIGKPAHSANPEKGINAVYKMCDLIKAIAELEPTHHDVLGDGILELVDIKSAPYPGASVVPERCIATYDRRLLVGETKESVIAPILECIEKLEAKDPQFKAKAYYSEGEEACFTGETIKADRFFPGWLFDKNEDWVVAIHEEMKKEGLNPEITQYNFCTNGSHYAGEAGIKTIGLGPSQENLAHTLNEYIELDELLKIQKGYVAVLTALLK